MVIPERRASARFFFHLVSDTEVIRDEDGLELSIDDVLSQAARAIEELCHEGFLAAEERQGWQIEIADSAGRVVLIIPLDRSDVACRPPVLN